MEKNKINRNFSVFQNVAIIVDILDKELIKKGEEEEKDSHGIRNGPALDSLSGLR